MIVFNEAPVIQDIETLRLVELDQIIDTSNDLALEQETLDSELKEIGRMCRIQVIKYISPIPEHLAHYTFTNQKQIKDAITYIRTAQDQLIGIAYTETNLASLGFEFKRRIKPILDLMEEKLEYRAINLEIAHTEIKEYVLEAIENLNCGNPDQAVNKITNLKDQILRENHRYSRQLSTSLRENLVSVLREIRTEMDKRINRS